MEIDYSRIGTLPQFVKNACFNHDAWIVGGGALYLCEKKEKVRDWDIVVPIDQWFNVSRGIPKGTPSNTFGGFKLNIEGIEIDIWTQDIGRLFMYDLAQIIAQPKTKQVLICNSQ